MFSVLPLPGLPQMGGGDTGQRCMTTNTEDGVTPLQDGEGPGGEEKTRNDIYILFLFFYRTDNKQYM